MYCPKITNLVIISLPNYLAFRRIPTQLSFYYLYGCVEQQGKVGVKSAREKKKDARENSQIFARETVFLPVKKKQKVPVKKKYAREKS